MTLSWRKPSCAAAYWRAKIGKAHTCNPGIWPDRRAAEALRLVILACDATGAWWVGGRSVAADL